MTEAADQMITDIIFGIAMLTNNKIYSFIGNETLTLKTPVADKLILDKFGVNLPSEMRDKLIN